MSVMVLIMLFFITLAKIQKGYADEAIRITETLEAKNIALAEKHEQLKEKAIQYVVEKVEADDMNKALEEELSACKNQ